MEIPEFKFLLHQDLQNICQEMNSDLSPVDFLPTRSNVTDTGYDVRYAGKEDILLKPGCYVKLPLGINMFAPPDWWLQCAPRSSTFAKLHLHPLYGIIDNAFSAQCMFLAQYLPDQCSLLSNVTAPVIKFGQRIAQFHPVKLQSMTCSAVSEQEFHKLIEQRGTDHGAGFGSSGKF